MVRNTIDSNIVGLAYATEVLDNPKTLPSSTVWNVLEPNSYSDFGGQLSTVARNPINANRQNKKGTPTDFEASGGFAIDKTATNLLDMLQGFFFADMQEKPKTKPLNGTQVTVTGVTSTAFTAAAGLGAFRAGHIVKPSGFGLANNNNLRVLTNASGTTLTTTGLSAETTPPANAEIEVVGFQFTAGDATLTVANGELTLGATTQNLTQFNLEVGEWIYIGGDATATRPTTSPTGWARVKSISAVAIIFDKVSSSFVSDTLSGKTLQIFFGNFLRNRTGSAIKRRTYQFERTLGSDANGVQAEYLKGAVPNTFTLNVPLTDKLTADLGFIAMEVEDRPGSLGLKAGTRVPAVAGDSAYNTTASMARVKLSELSPGTLEPTGLFAYLSNGSIAINNNASFAKAVGTLGAIDVNVGNFAVSGEATAYFQTLAAKTAVRLNADVTMDMIFAQLNTGFVFDIPLLSVGNAVVTVTADQAITLPLTLTAAENVNQYTLSYTNFPYLPDIAMPNSAAV